MSKHIALAYCQENEKKAAEIDAQLSKAGYTFQHIKDTAGQLNLQLVDMNSKVIVLISDNFLRNENCLIKGQTWFNRLKNAQQIIPLVIDGVREENGQLQTVKTSFEKVSNVIKYMNYWQDAYLDLRKSKRNISEEEEGNYEARLKNVRDISSEIGEFLRLIRSSDYIVFANFSENNYDLFFKLVGDISGHALMKYDKPNVFTEIPTTDTNTPAEVMEETHIAVDNVIEEEKIQEQTVEIEEVVEQEFEMIEEDYSEEDLYGIPGIAMLDNAVPKGKSISNGSDLVEEQVALSNPLKVNEIEYLFEEEKEEMLQEEDTTYTIEEEKQEVISVEELIANNEVEYEIMSEMPRMDFEKRNIENILKKSRKLLGEGDVPKVLNTLKKGTEDYPNEVHLRYYYAYVLANSAANTKAAKEELKKVLQQSPNHTDAHYLAGEIAEIDGDYFNAKNHYSAVVKTDKEYPHAQYKLGTILMNRFCDKEEEALAHLLEAINQDDENGNALLSVAQLYEKTEDLDNAKIYYQKYLDNNEVRADVYMALARIAQNNEESDEAMGYYKKAVDLEPNLATSENQSRFAPELYAKTSRVTIKGRKMEDLERHLAELQSKLSILETENSRQSFLASTQAQSSQERKKVDKTVLITGATSGIGKATAELFAKDGYRIILTGRRLERLEAQQQTYQDEYQADAQILNFDVRNIKEVNAAIESLEGKWANIDILINNAGLAKGFSSIQDGDMNHWEQMIDTNVKGLLYMTRAVAPNMVKRRRGHIINVCSTAGHEVYPNGNVYCATKHAVDALTKSMRIDLHKYNIRVGQISPGHVEETEFARVRFDGDAERSKIYEDFRPLTARDVAETIFFISTRPSYVNIQDVLLMGTQQASSNFIDRSGR